MSGLDLLIWCLIFLHFNQRADQFFNFNAELFLELYKITKNSLWLNRAYDFAQRALAYRTTTKNGDLWPADEPGLYSPDFLCGAAGTGYFFLQLLAPDQVRLPLL